ncbi:MAG TPA: cytochrome c oxidase assembly protein [Caldilineaceae bacterium]|nr:cytochrome c oxidase assembly protein [Caldilineaceae bacterium]
MRIVRYIVIGIATLIVAQPVSAHAGEPPAPHDLWQSWPWEPWIVVGLALGALLYLYGLRRLWRRAGWGRVVSTRQVLCFSSGLLVIAIALLSPLAAVSNALFSAHMIQHILLMNVAAPLLIWGLEPTLVLWALPVATRRGVGRWWRRRALLQTGWRWLNQPLVVWAIYALTLWIWHAPRFYQAAIASEAVHLLEHMGFIASALLFWWVLNQAGHQTLQLGAALLFLFTTALHSGLLAAIITFAQRPLYPIYAPYVWAWGLTLLSDQQLAGVIMWVPVGFVYLAALLWRLWQQLAKADAETSFQERPESSQVNLQKFLES